MVWFEHVSMLIMGFLKPVSWRAGFKCGCDMLGNNACMCTLVAWVSAFAQLKTLPVLRGKQLSPLIRGLLR